MRTIGLDEMNALGVDAGGTLYWHGKSVAITRLETFERWIVAIAAFGTLLSGLAAMFPQLPEFMRRLFQLAPPLPFDAMRFRRLRPGAERQGRSGALRSARQPQHVEGQGAEGAFFSHSRAADRDLPPRHPKMLKASICGADKLARRNRLAIGRRALREWRRAAKHTARW